MKYQLSGAEARVVGSLLEKQVTTPEQYPLSVNAVTMACNQKTNREPVMNLSEHDVQEVLDGLVKRHYLRTVSGFGNRVTKYEQRFCNSEFGDLKLSSAEVAVITTLLLRGAQTPGNGSGRVPPVCMSSATCRRSSRRLKGWRLVRMALTWCAWRASRENAKAAICISSAVTLTPQARRLNPIALQAVTALPRA
jgi:Uncharacterized protein conserved in bacteria